MKIVRYFLAALLVLGLLMVRNFQNELFYDPLLAYFQGDFLNSEFPEFNHGKHLMSLSLRYLINSLLSLGIIHLIFQDKAILKISGLLFLLLWVITLPLYWYFISSGFSQFVTAGFYVRRILIQPILLLVLLPAGWYYLRSRNS